MMKIHRLKMMNIHTFFDTCKHLNFVLCDQRKSFSCLLINFEPIEVVHGGNKDGNCACLEEDGPIVEGSDAQHCLFDFFVFTWDHQFANDTPKLCFQNLEIQKLN